MTVASKHYELRKYAFLSPVVGGLLETETYKTSDRAMDRLDHLLEHTDCRPYVFRIVEVTTYRNGKTAERQLW